MCIRDRYKLFINILMARKHSFMGYHEKDKRSKYFSFEDGKRPTGDMSWNRKACALSLIHI